MTLLHDTGHNMGSPQKRHNGYASAGNPLQAIVLENQLLKKCSEADSTCTNTNSFGDRKNLSKTKRIGLIIHCIQKTGSVFFSACSAQLIAWVISRPYFPY